MPISLFHVFYAVAAKCTDKYAVWTAEFSWSCRFREVTAIFHSLLIIPLMTIVHVISFLKEHKIHIWVLGLLLIKLISVCLLIQAENLRRRGRASQGSSKYKQISLNTWVLANWPTTEFSFLFTWPNLFTLCLLTDHQVFPSSYDQTHSHWFFAISSSDKVFPLHACMFLSASIKREVHWVLVFGVWQIGYYGIDRCCKWKATSCTLSGFQTHLSSSGHHLLICTNSLCYVAIPCSAHQYPPILGL